MLKKIFFIFLAFFIFLGGAKAVYDINRPPQRVEIVIDAAYVDRTFNLVNEERVKAGLKPLARNVQLDKSAELKLNDMLEKQYWSHYSPDGKHSWRRVTVCKHCGEWKRK